MNENLNVGKSMVKKWVVILGYIGFVCSWVMGFIPVDMFNDMNLVIFYMATMLFIDSVFVVVKHSENRRSVESYEENNQESSGFRDIFKWIHIILFFVFVAMILSGYIVMFISRGDFEKGIMIAVAFIVIVGGYIDRKIRGKFGKVKHAICIVGVIVVVGGTLVLNTINIEKKMFEGETREYNIKDTDRYISIGDMGIEEKPDYFYFRKRKSVLANEFYNYVEATPEGEGLLVQYIELRGEWLSSLFIKNFLVGERSKAGELVRYKESGEYSIDYLKREYDNVAIVKSGYKIIVVKWSFGDIEKGVELLDERVKVLLK